MALPKHNYTGASTPIEEPLEVLIQTTGAVKGKYKYVGTVENGIIHHSLGIYAMEYVLKGTTDEAELPRKAYRGWQIDMLAILDTPTTNTIVEIR